MCTRVTREEREGGWTHVFDDLYQVLEQGLSLLVGDDGCCDVSEYVGTAGLNSIQVTTEHKRSHFPFSSHTQKKVSMYCLLLLVEEDLDDLVLTLGVVEIDKEAPVDQPGTILQPHQMRSTHLDRHVHNTTL